jgi:hypothetical protein
LVLSLVIYHYRHAVGQGREECHPKCKTCHLFDYNLEWHCVECMEGYELWVDGCYAPCGAGKFRFGTACTPCTANCDECFGARLHECMRCSAGYEMDPRGLCMKTCNRGFYSANDASECLECNARCKECMDGSEVACISCYEPEYVLRVLEPRTQSGQCMNVCPPGYFRDAPSDLRCIQCPILCTACTSVDLCTSCVPSANLYNKQCYANTSESLQDQITFETFLESGAGVQWDPEAAPLWTDLVQTD